MKKPPTDGPRVAAFIEKATTHVKGRWANQRDPRIVLEPWQHQLLGDIFELDPKTGLRVYNDVLVGIPRKAGKSLLIAGIGHFLLSPMDGEWSPEIISAAGSRDQARFLHDVARKQVDRSPILTSMMRVMRNAILCPENDGSWRVVSAEAGLQQGANVHAGLIDEYHEHRDDAMRVALQMGMGARDQGILFTISTAASDLQTPLGVVYESMLQSPDVTRSKDGCLTIARNRGTGELMYWWAAPTEADIEDPLVLRGCNPGSWTDIDGLLKTLHKPSTREEEFRRYHCNQWVKVEGGAIPEQDWKACEEPGVRIPPGSQVYVGIDFAWIDDCSAVVMAWQRPDGRIVLEATIWQPPGGDVELDLSVVTDRVREIHRNFKIRECVYDPKGFVYPAQMLQGDGVRMVAMPQGDDRMGQACGTLYEKVRAGVIVHGGDAEFTRHALNAEVRSTGDGRAFKFIKPKGNQKKKIDALVAAAMALDRLVNREQTAYSKRGLRTL